MSRFAIGDLQGCADELEDLLALIGFEAGRDELFFVGDLVNRGPDSLRALRRVRELGASTVLGNHDLHLLALAAGCAGAPRKRDTLDDVLTAPDRDELLDWLRRQPLLIETGETLIVHAGLAPQWDPREAAACAREVEAILGGADYPALLANMYGDAPARWSDALAGIERHRFIVNCFTRMRFCYPDGSLDLDFKGGLEDRPERLCPWFSLRQDAGADRDIVFGHWSTLRLGEEDCERYRVWPLDTGCVWGGALTAMDLDSRERYSVPARSSTTKL